MTARVLAALLFSERDTLTAGDIAQLLSISTGSVLTALKTLISVGLIENLPAPGSRREHFRFPEGAWARLMSEQNQLVKVMRGAAEQGIGASGTDSLQVATSPRCGTSTTTRGGSYRP
ncbi:GbsR/MarR family transcriptional regulator [Micromonospora globbae]|uniref:GbsR/MarR family transcriptional regulator n=1 Tax=Micromonospora globbae TaxID=1894969 RepID=UPI001EFF8A97|nr:MarR family transcriptional regulator [Micromonospora globbae]